MKHGRCLGMVLAVIVKYRLIQKTTRKTTPGIISTELQLAQCRYYRGSGLGLREDTKKPNVGPISRLWGPMQVLLIDMEPRGMNHSTAEHFRNRNAAGLRRSRATHLHWPLQQLPQLPPAFRWGLAQI